MDNKTDQELIEKREDLIAILEKDTNGALDDTIGSLLEIERELTLRENK